MHRLSEQLLGCDVWFAEPIGRGGNNAIFRVQTATGRFAVKRYIESPGDRRDRIGAEFGALSFLAAAGESAVPRAVAADLIARVAAYEWIEGTAVEQLRAADLESVVGFVARLHGYRDVPAATRLPNASEACLTSAEITRQIEHRLKSLEPVSGSEQALSVFLRESFGPAWMRIRDRIGSDQVLTRRWQTLSPSDVGRHNMLRRSDGALVFLDFEYFGWDDPVKLIADILWHPGSALDANARERIAAGAHAIFGADPGYASRFARWYPVFGLRWALIVLAEFLPERWERRRRAGECDDWPLVKARQLQKARILVDAALAFAR